MYKRITFDKVDNGFLAAYGDDDFYAEGRAVFLTQDEAADFLKTFDFDVKDETEVEAEVA